MRKNKWDMADWTKTNSQIAKEIGVSRQAVSQRRKEWKIPDPPLKHIHTVTAKILTTIQEINTESMSLSDIQRFLKTRGIDVSIIKLRRLLDVYKISSVTFQSPTTTNFIESACLNMDTQELKLGEIRVKLKAKFNLDVTSQFLCNILINRNIPWRRRLKKMIDWSSVDWSKPNYLIAKEKNIDAHYVSAQRRKIGRPNWRATKQESLSCTA